MKFICDNEDSQQGDTAEVTSATDDHEKDQKHFEATTAERNSTTENKDSNPTKIRSTLKRMLLLKRYSSQW